MQVLTDMDTAALINQLRIIDNEIAEMDFSALASDPALASLQVQVAGWPSEPWRGQLNLLGAQLDDPSLDLSSLCCANDSSLVGAPAGVQQRQCLPRLPFVAIPGVFSCL